MKNETRGRPRQFDDPTNYTLRFEKKDRARWQNKADQAGKSFASWLIEAGNEKASKAASPANKES
jgi:predicted HicB family RNase H-like nuclease